MENLNEIKEINQHISDALEQWSNIMIQADADKWSYNLEYSDRDLLNALQMFDHVAANIAIKNGFLTEKNIVEKMVAFVLALEKAFGFNSIELAKKVLINGDKTT